MNINVNKVLIGIARMAISKKEFAELAGMNAETLNSILRRKKCRVETVGRIANALGVPVEEIITIEEAQSCQA